MAKRKIPVSIYQPPGHYQTYIPRKFNNQSRTLIDRINRIIGSYQQQGYDLTLRQVYYRLVAADIIPNTPESYNRTGELITAARRAGLVMWDALTDRGRYLRSLTHWGSPDEIVRAAADSWRIDKWADQPNRIEVWVEKDALIGVVGRACEALDVPYFSSRGNCGDQEMWNAAQRLLCYHEAGQHPIVFHLGDHDPTGIDITRDIITRLDMYTGGIPVDRLALNMDQITRYEPPANPAKVTDSRYAKYAEKYGDESWELDALEPTVINEIITDAILARRDDELWEAAKVREEEQRELLTANSERWYDVSKFLRLDKATGERLIGSTLPRIARYPKARPVSPTYGGMTI